MKRVCQFAGFVEFARLPEKSEIVTSVVTKHSDTFQMETIR